MFTANFCDFYLQSSFSHGGISLGPCCDAQTLLASLFIIFFIFSLFIFSFRTHYYLIFYSFYFLSSKNICYSKCLRPQRILLLPEAINCHIKNPCLGNLSSNCWSWGERAEGLSIQYSFICKRKPLVVSVGIEFDEGLYFASSVQHQ